MGFLRTNDLQLAYSELKTGDFVFDYGILVKTVEVNVDFGKSYELILHHVIYGYILHFKSFPTVPRTPKSEFV